MLKLVGLSLISACVSVGGFAQSGDPAKPKTPSITVIESLIRSHRYDEALEAARAGLKDAPDDYRLWTLDGIILSLKSDTKGALPAFEKALQLSPGYTPALKGAAQILFQTGDRRAAPLLERILQADPRDLTAHEMLGTLQRRNGDCRSADEHFLLAADAIRTHAESLEAYGYCLVEMRSFDQAIPVFQQLAALLPNRTYPKYDLAVVLVLTRQYEAAISALQPLLTDDQKDPDVLSLAAQAYEATKNTPKAVALLRQAIVLSPTTPDYYVTFASLCLDHDSFQVGVDMMNVGLRYIPDNPSLHISRGLLYVELAEFDKAEADFMRVEQLDSAHSLGAYALDLTEVQRNNPDAALAKVRSQLKTHPDDPLLNFFLATSLMNHSPDAGSDDFKEAMRAALKAVNLKPDYVPARDLLASMYMHAGQYDRAIEQCRIALQQTPSDETATYHLLIALKHSGGSDELPALAKRLAQLHKESLQQENERKSYRLVEADPDAVHEKNRSQ
jgi:tetratricopeptide (TPR) repeat protein